MALSDLTVDAIRQAITEFDNIGRDAFLQRYGYGKSRGYFLRHNGSNYDSKAIVGAAHGYVAGRQALAANEFSGGDKTVAKRLRDLGFEVLEPSDTPSVGIPFEVGNVYHRQNDIHQVFGGQERGGIATPGDCPFVFLFTGESGEQFGYSDGWRPDGVFAYTGEGQKGDMTFVRGNRAIRDHMADGRDLLLFEAMKTKGNYRFMGCFAFAGWETVKAPDRDKQQRNTIVFELVPVPDSGPAPHVEPIEANLRDKSLNELRSLALAAAATPRTPSKESQRTYYARSAKVKAYVLKRANGHCEACKKPAPFLRSDGTAYLEPHHIKRVADGGPDHPHSVGAVCPTCHRLIHHGDGGAKLNRELEKYVLEIEQVQELGSAVK
ncbi:HNH endonuclease signature motif containing protein [Bradyrhizobium diazoefficiens]|uniref:HNH endonuclease n=1 Tax=Bradyrhizobium diazoefficiens TaxID=1355477 RepID=UPI002B45F450|nr:HNH endonuclease signature motif containing protein [Bradyrhizobium diazoefficiens]WRI94870.1 HNH endonuclease signature motif containing protein [Bradyrhizobium diazoefficiens]